MKIENEIMKKKSRRVVKFQDTQLSRIPILILSGWPLGKKQTMELWLTTENRTSCYTPHNVESLGISNHYGKLFFLGWRLLVFPVFGYLKKAISYLGIQRQGTCQISKSDITEDNLYRKHPNIP